MLVSIPSLRGTFYITPPNQHRDTEAFVFGATLKLIPRINLSKGSVCAH